MCLQENKLVIILFGYSIFDTACDENKTTTKNGYAKMISQCNIYNIKMFSMICMRSCHFR